MRAPSRTGSCILPRHFSVEHTSYEVPQMCDGRTKVTGVCSGIAQLVGVAIDALKSPSVMLHNSQKIDGCEVQGQGKKKKEKKGNKIQTRYP